MLSDADRRKAAEILIAAEESRTPALQLSKTWPDIQIEDSYAISSLVTEMKAPA
jgi:2-oxo-hept-3-ene-1,7-dioate hydratase